MLFHVALAEMFDEVMGIILRNFSHSIIPCLRKLVSMGFDFKVIIEVSATWCLGCIMRYHVTALHTIVRCFIPPIQSFLSQILTGERIIEKRQVREAGQFPKRLRDGAWNQFQQKNGRLKTFEQFLGRTSILYAVLQKQTYLGNRRVDSKISCIRSPAISLVTLEHGVWAIRCLNRLRPYMKQLGNCVLYHPFNSLYPKTHR